MRRADAAINVVVEEAAERISSAPWSPERPIDLDARAFAVLPGEVALRLLGRAVDCVGDEGPVELGKLEALYEALRQAPGRLRRTLAGALVTLDADRLTVERAPARRSAAMRQSRKGRFTK